MRYTILFVIALICVSGFIAYFGDLLGRKMGKKRLTLFSLRPRYTAIVVTTITGMLISTFALVTLVSVNSQFRKVLLRGEQILAQNNSLSSENAKLGKLNHLLFGQSEDLKKQVEKQQREVAAARATASKAKANLAKAVMAVKRLEKDIALRQKELTELKSRTDIAESELKERQLDLIRIRADLSAARGNLSMARLKLARTQTQLVTKAIELQKKQAELEASEKNRQAFEFNSAIARSRQFICFQGDEIVRGKINPNQSVFGLRGDLYSLLELASDKATKDGAKQGDNGRSVVVVVRVVKGRESIILDNEPDYVNEAINTISTAPMDVLVRVVCAVNTLPDEQVPVELKLYINKQVYAKGDKIAETKLDGHLSEGRILLALVDFMQKDVAKSALDAGIVPVSNLNNRRLSFNENPTEQIDQLMSAVERIKSINAPVNITVFADAAVYASDTLNMDNMRLSINKAE